MKITSWTFHSKALVAAGAILMTASAGAQSTQPSAPKGSPAPVPSSAPRTPSSNQWDSLRAMSADRCTAEAIGTASDPRTGAPVAKSIDPQTGKPICPSAQPANSAKPSQ